MCELMKEEIVVIESVIPKPSFEDSENAGPALQSRVREVVHQMYRYTFEVNYYNDMLFISNLTLLIPSYSRVIS